MTPGTDVSDVVADASAAAPTEPEWLREAQIKWSAQYSASARRLWPTFPTS